jgi:hypothetical protein
VRQGGGYCYHDRSSSPSVPDTTGIPKPPVFLQADQRPWKELFGRSVEAMRAYLQRAMSREIANIDSRVGVGSLQKPCITSWQRYNRLHYQDPLPVAQHTRYAGNGYAGNIYGPTNDRPRCMISTQTGRKRWTLMDCMVEQHMLLL